MASQGPNIVGTGADDNSVGTVAWTNPSNITAADATYATITAALGGNQISHYLKGTNCGFTIPSGSTVNGIVVEIQKSYSGVPSGINTLVDNEVKIIKGGVVGSTNKADTVTNWPRLSAAYASYGSSNDLWGETWTDTDINAANFGIVISAKYTRGKVAMTLRVDAIRITVYYTLGSTTSEISHVNNAVLSNFMVK